MTLKYVDDTKGVFKSHRSKKDRQSNDQRKRTKKQTWSTKYYGTVKTEQHDPPPNKKRINKEKYGGVRRCSRPLNSYCSTWWQSVCYF
jgi:hypothetical protein